MFQKYKFGMVEFDNKKYFHDIVIHVDGRVDKRDKNPSKMKYGTSHILCREEIEGLVHEKPEILVIGCGQSGALKVGEDAREILNKKNIELTDLTTQKAIIKYNTLKNLSRRVAAVIHVTC